ncbi:transmembrane protein 45B-like [Pecten maximus]|uniref:transmembrane protein 45B-like n=1 Tax=Pecten maximus TaxID=6579 RepID=UPI001458FFFD|nr:transmembrane protein 45B-like [Pecten maximus]
MGAFWGHADMGIFFMALGLWWLYNIFRDYFMSGCDLNIFRSRISYGLPCKPRIPIEIIMKLLFIGGVILFEFSTSGLHFISKDGNFRNIIYLQHLTMFGIFFIHALVDLMEWIDAPVPRGSAALTGAFAFGWTALSMYYHVKVGNREQVDVLLHTMPNYVIYMLLASFLYEHYHGYKGILAPTVRAFSSLFLGTWFIQEGWVLFVHDRFPGGEKNPEWDLADERNAHFIPVAFGCHLLVDFIIVAILYVVLYFVYIPKSRLACLRLWQKWRPLKTSDEDENECLLLGNDDKEDMFV